MKRATLDVGLDLVTHTCSSFLHSRRTSGGAILHLGNFLNEHLNKLLSTVIIIPTTTVSISDILDTDTCLLYLLTYTEHTLQPKYH